MLCSYFWSPSSLPPSRRAIRCPPSLPSSNEMVRETEPMDGDYGVTRVKVLSRPPVLSRWSSFADWPPPRTDGALCVKIPSYSLDSHFLKLCFKKAKNRFISDIVSSKVSLSESKILKVSPLLVHSLTHSLHISYLFKEASAAPFC